MGSTFILKRGGAPGFQNEAIVTLARGLAATLACVTGQCLVIQDFIWFGERVGGTAV